MIESRRFEESSYNYSEGYRNGRLDARNGTRLVTALTAPDEDYARGYRDGQVAALYDDEGGEA